MRPVLLGRAQGHDDDRILLGELIERRRGEIRKGERLHEKLFPWNSGAMNYSFHFAPVINRIDQLLSGLLTTVWVSGAAIILGFLLGLVGAYAIRSRWSGLRLLLTAYAEVIRNTPLLAQLFFIYFGLPGIGIRLDAVAAALLALVVNLGAYTTEIVRGGLDAVPA